MPRPFVVWDGLTEYREALRQLPATCTVEASHIIEGEVNIAFRKIATVYSAHVFTGTLLKKLTIQPLSDIYRTGRLLRSGSPLAWLFDNGSQARHYVTASGAEHKTGKMWGKTPPTHIFARTVAETKRTISAKLRDLILRQGATSVSGDEAA